jgi:hypothetical protein
MQKIDFVRSLETIVEKLSSEEILLKLDESFKRPNDAFPFHNITPLLFLSKSNFDQLHADENFSEILETVNENGVYSANNLAILAPLLIHKPALNLVIHPSFIKLYNFHASLVLTLKLAKQALLNDSMNKGFEEYIQNGVLIFQVVIEGEGLETEKYIKIFAALEDLVEAVSKVNGNESKAEIILLDSGSDTNIGIKTVAETAKSIFLIFKEIWDYIINYRYYKNKQRNGALLESLTIRAEIEKKVQEGVITPEEGKEYMHLIKSRTDNLIGLKVLPKQIVIDRTVVDNKKMIEEFENVKFLISPENQSDENYA